MALVISISKYNDEYDRDVGLQKCAYNVDNQNDHGIKSPE